MTPTPSTGASRLLAAFLAMTSLRLVSGSEETEPEKSRREPGEGMVVILSSTDVIKNDFLMQGGEYAGNAQFYYRLIDSLCLGDRLMEIGLAGRSGVPGGISEATRQVLAQLRDPVHVRYHVSDAVPAGLGNLKADTLRVLQEIGTGSQGKVTWETVAPEKEGRRFAAEKVREYFELKRKGQTPREPTPPVRFEDIISGPKNPRKSEAEIEKERRKKAQDEAGRAPDGPGVEEIYKRLLTEEFEESYFSDLQARRIYRHSVEEPGGRKSSLFTAIEMTRGGRSPEVIPVHRQVEDLEFELVSKVLKLTRLSKPRVVFFDGRKPPAPSPEAGKPETGRSPSQYSAMINVLGEHFEMEETDLNR